MSNKYQPVPENMQQDPDGLWRAAVPSPTENTEELEKALLVDPVFQHILKFAPQSQRELMTFELAKYFASREHQAVQAALREVPAIAEAIHNSEDCYVAKEEEVLKAETGWVNIIEAEKIKAVQAFGEKVLKDPRCFIAYSKRNPDGSRQRVPEKMVIPVSVITSLLKGANQ